MTVPLFAGNVQVTGGAVIQVNTAALLNVSGRSIIPPPLIPSIPFLLRIVFLGGLTVEQSQLVILSASSVAINGDLVVSDSVVVKDFSSSNLSSAGTDLNITGCIKPSNSTLTLNLGSGSTTPKDLDGQKAVVATRVVGNCSTTFARVDLTGVTNPSCVESTQLLYLIFAFFSVSHPLLMSKLTARII